MPNLAEQITGVRPRLELVLELHHGARAQGVERAVVQDVLPRACCTLRSCEWMKSENKDILRRRRPILKILESSNLFKL